MEDEGRCEEGGDGIAKKAAKSTQHHTDGIHILFVFQTTQRKLPQKLTVFTSDDTWAESNLDQAKMVNTPNAGSFKGNTLYVHLQKPKRRK